MGDLAFGSAPEFILQWILCCLVPLCSKLQIRDMWPCLANQLCSDWTLSSSLWYPLYQAQCNRSTSCFVVFIYLFTSGYPGSSPLARTSISRGRWGHSSSQSLVSLLCGPPPGSSVQASRAAARGLWSRVSATGEHCLSCSVAGGHFLDQGSTLSLLRKILLHCTIRSPQQVIVAKAVSQISSYYWKAFTNDQAIFTTTSGPYFLEW